MPSDGLRELMRPGRISALVTLISGLGIFGVSYSAQ